MERCNGAHSVSGYEGLTLVANHFNIMFVIFRFVTAAFYSYFACFHSLMSVTYFIILICLILVFPVTFGRALWLWRVCN